MSQIKQKKNQMDVRNNVKFKTPPKLPQRKRIRSNYVNHVSKACAYSSIFHGIFMEKFFKGQEVSEGTFREKIYKGGMGIS